MQDGTMQADVIALSKVESLVKSIVLNAFPVGTVISNTTGVNPSQYLGGTWQEVAGSRVLQGADSSHQAGTTIEAGLPNIASKIAQSEFNKSQNHGYGERPDNLWGISGEQGAGQYEDSPLYWMSTKYNSAIKSRGDSTTHDLNVTNGGRDLGFDASRANPIYGKSKTVQPPAYVVHFYQRTA